MYSFQEEKDTTLLRETIRKFAQEEIAPKAHDLDEREEFSYEITRKMGDLGLFGTVIPQEYGGQGMDCSGAGRFCELASFTCVSGSLSVRWRNHPSNARAGRFARASLPSHVGFSVCRDHRGVGFDFDAARGCDTCARFARDGFRAAPLR
ncbi:MAG: acyl-CoA dehydrogenase family protein [Beijerinckiaceae bacterium]|nr:acyl-CoA dehydrogenase family protein [Beijerinckiaceae bacterium]